MTPELFRLYKAREQAYQQYQAVQMMNIVGKTPEERVEMDITAEHVRQNWIDVIGKYNRELEQHVKDQRK